MWVWRGWLAWGARDRPAFAHAAASLAGERFATEEPRTRMWGRALRVLAARDLAECDRAGDVAVETALDEFEALARETGDPECRVFARVITREAACDHVRVRVAVHRGAAALSAGTSVIGALACRLESRAAEGKAMSLSYAASATQSLEGLEGFRRWEQRRIPTMVIDNVSALLDIVHDSDDEQGALERACAWTRTSTRATAVGVFDAADRRCLAGDAAAASPTDASDESFLGDVWARGEPGVHRAQGFETAAGPVRYGGITIAFVIARGVADTMTMLAEGVRAVASISAPLVRARLDALGVCARADELATGILGASPAMAAVRAEVARAATAPFSVLIEGESGTGKELVARALHRLGPRRDRRFCACNCAAFTDELFESELFGHARGAFTGAVAARAGLFEEAHRGTLFLDEVAELSPRAQAKLLRVLQEGEIRRVGENAPRAIDVRIVAATNRTLAAQVASGNFREDLLFRLAVVRISLPPLRERVEDIAVLAQTLWRESARRAGSHALMGPDAIAALCRNTWPGNVRQLQNALAALAVVAPARGRVSARHVHHVLAGLGGGVVEPDVSLDVARRTAERRAVAAALARHAGRRRAAARELGLSRQGLTKAIRRLGLMAS